MWESLGEIFSWTARGSLYAVGVIFIIVLVQVLLHRALSERWSYTLWMILLARMVIPVGPEWEMSLWNLAPHKLMHWMKSDTAGIYQAQSAGRNPVSTQAMRGGIPPAAGHSIPVRGNAGPSAPSNNAVSESAYDRNALLSILPAIWLAGAMAVMSGIFFSNLRLWRSVRGLRFATDSALLELFEDCRQRMRVRTTVSLVVTGRVKSPLLFGFFRPRVLVPEDLVRQIPAEQLRYIFLHELAHLKRHDILIGWLLAFLQALHWFNPLVWWAFSRMRFDRELACDASVLARVPDGERRHYGGTLIGMLERFSNMQHMPAVAGILENGTQLKVGVGIMVTHNPLHGSGRADFPHPALASGDDAKPPQRIGVADLGGWQVAVDESPHPVPKNPAILAAMRQCTVPESAHLKPEYQERMSVRGHTIIPIVPTDDRAQPFAYLRNGIVHPLLELGLHLAQLRLQPLADRLPYHGKPSITPLLPADVREAEKVERLGLPLSTFPPVLGRERSELQQSRLLGMQLQSELPKTLDKFRPEPLSIQFALEPNHDVVRKPYDDYIAAGQLPAPHLGPQIKCVVKVDVRQERRCTATLRRSLLHPHPLPILQHAGVQPFLDEPHDAPVRNPVLDELHQPLVVNGIEEATNVDVEHPVHLSRQQSRVERIQRIVLAASRPEPVREAEKVRFIDGVHHLDRRTLDDLILQRGHAERSLPPVGLGNVYPTNRLRPVRPAFQPFGQILEIALQPLSVVPPRLAIHTRCGFPLKSEVCPPKCFDVVDVVQERREPQLPILSCRLSYPLQRIVHTFPARCPGRVLLSQVPFGQALSLHPLRSRLLGLVRGLHRYHGPVRLPMSVHHRRTSLDFPMRPATPFVSGGHGISRFSCEVFPCVLGVSDRAGLRLTLRYRCTECGLPHSPTASAPRSKFLSRLNTRPARTPVNASTPPLRAAPHDSGPVWVANPSPYDSFIHNTSPVYPGAQEIDHDYKIPASNTVGRHMGGYPDCGAIRRDAD